MSSMRIAGGLLAAAGLLLAVSPAQAGKVKIKNCLQERVYACAYDGKDNSFAIPASMTGIKAGRQDALKCSSERCKVFLAVSDRSQANYIAEGLVAGGFAAKGGFIGGVLAAKAAGAGTMATLGAAGAGAAAAVGVAFGVAKGIEGLENGRRCKRIVKHAKQGKLGDRLKAKGEWTLTQRVIDGTDQVVLLEGHHACGWDESTVEAAKEKEKKRKKKRKKRLGL